MIPSVLSFTVELETDSTLEYTMTYGLRTMFEVLELRDQLHAQLQGQIHWQRQFRSTAPTRLEYRIEKSTEIIQYCCGACCFCVGGGGTVKRGTTADATAFSECSLGYLAFVIYSAKLLTLCNLFSFQLKGIALPTHRRLTSMNISKTRLVLEVRFMNSFCSCWTVTLHPLIQGQCGCRPIQMNKLFYYLSLIV